VIEEAKIQLPEPNALYCKRIRTQLHLSHNLHTRNFSHLGFVIIPVLRFDLECESDSLEKWMEIPCEIILLASASVWWLEKNWFSCTDAFFRNPMVL
jgi:hypothetical protein